MKEAGRSFEDFHSRTNVCDIAAEYLLRRCFVSVCQDHGPLLPHQLRMVLSQGEVCTQAYSRVGESFSDTGVGNARVLVHGSEVGPSVGFRTWIPSLE